MMLDSLTPTRRLAVLGGAVGSLLLLVLIAVFSFTGGLLSYPASQPRASNDRCGRRVGAVAVAKPVLSGRAWHPAPRAFPAVTPSTSTRYPAIPAAGRPCGVPEVCWPVSCGDAAGQPVGHDDQPCPFACST